MKSELNRINELAKKAKTEGLTDKEKIEQKELRGQYLKRFRSAFEKHLHGLTVVDELGNDVTPEKLKKSKKRRHKH
ncbi:DUF896 domain-containing protein [Pueribacillus theae]|uniref:DUF896 domain-containing protein n=1 Tax=Pueribacillus theae TaxID=2171751 RepID=UPI002683A3CC